MHLGSIGDLVTRIGNSLEDDEARPLAILCGSGLTRDAVPGTPEVIDIIIKAVNDGQDRAGLEESLLGVTLQSERYQQAFQYLTRTRPPSFRERIIRAVTLNAYQGANPTVRPSEMELGQFEENLANWDVPRGTAALGRILNGLPEALRGPVLTTNFDPLIEIAVRRSGGPATTFAQVDDSSFLTNLRIQSGTAAVVHLHGFWRGSTTLHTVDQLDKEKPALTSALRAILESHTLLVVGYGGWSDVITRQILQTLRERGSETLDIVWALHESGDDAENAFEQAAVLNSLRTEAPGNVVFYQGVDANDLFTGLESRLADLLDYTEAPVSSQATQSVLGWSTISQPFIDRRRKGADEAAALAFFDGRLPTWEDAVNAAVPVRGLTLEVVNVINSVIPTRQSSMTTLIGPSGEGKSTILMQAAVQLKEEHPELNVLSLSGDDFGSAESFLALNEKSAYLLVADNAADHLNQIEKLVTALHERSRHQVHILLASGDSDWRSRGGHTFAWSRRIKMNEIAVAGVSRADALALVAGWEKLGPEALGALADIDGQSARVDELVRVAEDDIGPAGGTLLGALLVTRYGAGLRDHVRSLMVRLSEREVFGSWDDRVTLLDALVTASFMHSNDVHELTYELFGRALGISEAALHANVLGPLGMEAAISRSLGKVSVRHRLIADVICDLAPDFSIPLSDVCRHLVMSAVELVEAGNYEDGLIRVAYLSKNLVRHRKLREVAAIAAVEASPARLSYVTTLSSIQRNRDSAVAAKTNRNAVNELSHAKDPQALSGFLMEWGIAEGKIGNDAFNVVLTGASLRDGIIDNRSRSTVAWNFACLVFAFTRYWEATRETAAINGLRAALDFSEQFGIEKHPEWRAAAEQALLKGGYGLGYPVNVRAASRARDLQSGWEAARRAVSADLPTGLPLGAGFTYVTRMVDNWW